MKVQCHCGNISLEAKTPAQITSCNCSICARYNALWGYYPPHEVKISVGDMGEDFYIWGDRDIEFVRCTNCGCVTHYRTTDKYPKPKIAINYRMAKPEEIANILVQYFDGAKLL